jgi:uncharacterized membrane protein (UPF0127 family)
MRRQAMGAVIVSNTTRNTPLVTSGRVADNMFTRLRGLIGARPLGPGEGLLIMPCSSVHTHFMSFPIDVVYVNLDLQVVAIDAAMAPWRFGKLRKGVRFVIELAAGEAKRARAEVGDQLEVMGYEF